MAAGRAAAVGVGVEADGGEAVAGDPRKRRRPDTESFSGNPQPNLTFVALGDLQAKLGFETPKLASLGAVYPAKHPPPALGGPYSCARLPGKQPPRVDGGLCPLEPSPLPSAEIALIF